MSSAGGSLSISIVSNIFSNSSLFVYIIVIPFLINGVTILYVSITSFSRFILISGCCVLNSKAQIDTSVIYYQDSEYHALGGVDECVKDAVTKNRFPKEGTFFKSFIAGSRYLVVGYRYVNGTYGLIVLYRYGLKLDSRYSIESGIFSKIS